jgi:hypothetical protein
MKVIDENGDTSYKFEGKCEEPYSLPLLLQMGVPIYLHKEKYLTGISIKMPGNFTEEKLERIKGETYFGKKIISSDKTWLNLADTIIDLPNGKAWYRKYEIT